MLPPLHIPKKHSPKKWRTRAIRLVAVFAFLTITTWFVIPQFIPYDETALTGPPPSTLILDRDGSPLYHAPRDDHYRHQNSPLTGIPESLIQATLAAEDKRFFQHEGIDILANLRAIKDSIEAGHFVSGASTITQQTIKLTSGTPPRTIKEKIIEALKSRHLEMSTDKDTILAAYFNNLDYGNRTQGPRQAALHYFRKELDQLSLAEIALLAGIPQAPTRHNPRRNPDGAKQRRDWVLDRMAIVYNYPSDRITRAKNEPIKLAPFHSNKNTRQLALLAIPHREPSSPYIRTTISAPLQNTARKSLKQELALLQDKHVSNGAVVIIHNPTSEVLALVGTSDFDQNQINAALTPRSPGSALKPFTYLLAFENQGMSPATIIPDIPTSYAGIRGPEEFVNYDRSYKGPVTIHESLGNSLNIPAVRVLNEIGGPTPLAQLLKKIGITTLTKKPEKYGLGLTIGSAEVTLLQTTNAFATLARSGKFTPTKLFLNQESKTPTQSFSPESAFLITSILTDNHARAASFGTNSNLHLPFLCAVKTGTSSDFRDNFCIGYTREFTVGVWVGNLDNKPMKGISGVTGAGPVFKNIMLHVHKHTPPTWLTKPDTITKIAIDPQTGKRLYPNHPRHPLAIHTFAPKNRLPEKASLTDYTPDGKIYLDARYDSWLEQHPEKPFTPSREHEVQQPLRILSPAKDATYLLDPDLPDQGKYLPLISNQPHLTTWTCPTLEIINHHNTPTLVLTEGQHILTATHQKTKITHEITFHVNSL